MTFHERDSLASHLLRTVLSIIFVVTLTLSTLLFDIRYGRSTAPQHHSHTACPPSGKPMWDYSHVPNPAPVYSPIVFEPISNAQSFLSLEDAINDQTWDTDLQTPGGGFLMVVEADGKTVTGYGVSMYHQLHCLAMIRQILLGQPMSHTHEAPAWADNSMHWMNCLDYLANQKAVLCTADDTLEKPEFTENFRGELVKGIVGFGHTHQCRNATKLRQAVLDSEDVPRAVALLGGTTVFPLQGKDRDGKAWVVSEN